MNILFLCSENQVDKQPLLFDYKRTFNKRGHVLWFDARIANYHNNHNGNLLSVLDVFTLKPDLILHPGAPPNLPWGLTEVGVPTACFQIDTFGYNSHIIRWSMLFDYVLAFHPAFAKIVKEAGHPRVVLIPYAVNAQFYQKSSPERIYEVGWVGSLRQKFYATRRRVLPRLAARFRMNNWRCWHHPDKIPEVYKRSKIVVNVSRDDYPQDANMRVFDAMAAGALLITKIPTELTELGFKENKHFVGFRHERDIIDHIMYYLMHDDERSQIAEAGRKKVLQEHTYDNRVETMLNVLEEDIGQLSAPARRWSEEEIRLTYLHYYSNYLLLDCALSELCYLKTFGKAAVFKGIPLFVKAILRSLKKVFYVTLLILQSNRKDID